MLAIDNGSNLRYSLSVADTSGKKKRKQVKVNIVETVQVNHNLAVLADAVTLIKKWVPQQAVLTEDWQTEKRSDGTTKIVGIKLFKDGVEIGHYSGEGKAIGEDVARLLALYDRAVAEGTGFLDQMLEAEKATTKVKKAKSSSPVASGAPRGRLSQAQKEEIAELSKGGFTAEEIAEKTGRSADTVKQYMAQDNSTPVGVAAEADEMEVEEETEAVEA